MKITILNTLENGGAANACKRLKEGLEIIGESPFFLSKEYFETFQSKNKNPLNKITSYWKKRSVIKTNHRLLAGAIQKPDYFSLPFSYFSPHNHPQVQNAEVLNLHWCADLIPYDSFFRATRHIPMAITLHDMNYFTGGCHYSFHCEKFIHEQCDSCWQLEGAVKESTFSTFNLKKQAYSLRDKKNTVIVSPSIWLLEKSKKSELFSTFEHFHVPYGINTSLFSQIPQEEARKKIGIEETGKWLLFIASEIKLPRKGFQFVLDLLPFFKERKIKLLIVGHSSELDLPKDIVMNMGKVDSLDLLCACYSAADAMLLPTLADNLPNTMLESISCGTPVIGFKVGGLPDVIQQGKNGFLSDSLNSKGLMNSIDLFLTQGLSVTKEEIRQEALLKYNLETQAKNYLNIFTSIKNNLL